MTCFAMAFAFVAGIASSSARAQPPSPTPPARLVPDPIRAREALGPQGLGPVPGTSCAAGAEGLSCLIAWLYVDDDDARASALALFARHGVVAGVEAAWVMDGGFRGTLSLVPARPVGRDARHLRWVLEAHDAIAALFTAIAPRASRPIRYRHEGIVYAFLRSERRTTPSAYASEWHVGYNVVGSLNRSASAVLGTLVHEIFHLNDASDAWSRMNLGAIHARITARCGTNVRCLTPYAPTLVRVRGGTYYAFQPDNGAAVDEYGADLATRWFTEQQTMLAHGRLPTRPWKCLTPENASAYASITNAFFGGVDLTPGC